jgi:carbonic anhydrase/acetyltransferase-like protein (isoleucine patch superfamily)
MVARSDEPLRSDLRYGIGREPQDLGPIILSFDGHAPRIASTAWIAPGAAVVGDVDVGPESSIWYGAVVRGDVHCVRIGKRTNIQDQATVHVTRDRFSTSIGDEVTVGHRAVVHGCTIHPGALIGIGAVVLDGAEVGEGALVAAGAVVTPGSKVPAGQLAVGVPARVVRRLSDAERVLQIQRTLGYVELAQQHAREPAMGAPISEAGNGPD